MKKLIICLLSISSTSSFAIAGGKPISINNNDLAKYVVQVQSKFPDGVITACTGVIVKNNKVLTAAHCLYKDHSLSPTDVFVVFGNQNSSNRIRVKKVRLPKNAWQDLDAIVQGDINSDVQLGDIAMLTLTDNIPSPYKPIKVSQYRDMDSNVYSVGYGATYGDSFNKGVPNMGISNIQDYYGADVLEVRSNKPFNMNTPVGLKSVYTHICAEDSGGPDIQKIDGEYQLIGIHYGFVSRKVKPDCTDNDTKNIDNIKFISTDVTKIARYWVMQYMNDDPSF